MLGHGAADRAVAISTKFGPLGMPHLLLGEFVLWKSAQDHAFGALGRCRVWEAHHAERIEQSHGTGENRNEKCYLKG